MLLIHDYSFLSDRKALLCLIIISWGLSSCSSSPTTFPCLCDLPPTPNFPSNQVLNDTIKKEEAAAKQKEPV